MPRIPVPAVALLSAAVAAAICTAALSLAPDEVARVVLWPLSGLALAFPPPCFDRGPGREPFCEGTPIQMLAGSLGLCLSWPLPTMRGHHAQRRESWPAQVARLGGVLAPLVFVGAVIVTAAHHHCHRHRGPACPVPAVGEGH